MGYEDRHHPNSLLKVCTNYTGRSGWNVKGSTLPKYSGNKISRGKAYLKCRTTPLARWLSCLNPSGERGTRTKFLTSKWPRLRESRKVNSIIIWQGGQGHQTISRMLLSMQYTTGLPRGLALASTVQHIHERPLQKRKKNTSTGRLVGYTF